MKKVSAIITTHNRLPLLKRAIDSVRTQTYPDIECIVVDDASTDGTQEYCQSLPDVRYLRIPPEESRGGNYARNTGIRAAQGDYIALLDDDDCWLPEKTDKQVRLLQEKNCGLVYCLPRMEIISANGKTRYKNIKPEECFHGDMSRRILMLINCCTTSLMLVRKDLLVQIGLFDENIRYWQDYELTLRAAQVTPFYFVPEQLCIYRQDNHDRQRLTNRLEGWEDNQALIYHKHNRLYAQLGFLEQMWRKRIWLRDSSKRYKKAGRLRRYHLCRLRFLALSLLFVPAKLSKTLRHRLYSQDLIECMRLPATCRECRSTPARVK